MSSVEPSRNFGVSLEEDRRTLYLYLFDLKRSDGTKIINHLHISSNKPDWNGREMEIRWNDAGDMVGLIISGRLWGVFDIARMDKFGGDFAPDKEPDVPEKIASLFSKWH